MCCMFSWMPSPRLLLPRVFLRSIDNDDSVTVCLVAAKSKVAPISATSIPRLELMAAEIS